jgi:hypothetical protein
MMAWVRALVAEKNTVRDAHKQCFFWRDGGRGNEQGSRDVDSAQWGRIEWCQADGTTIYERREIRVVVMQMEPDSKLADKVRR